MKMLAGGCAMWVAGAAHAGAACGFDFEAGDTIPGEELVAVAIVDIDADGLQDVVVCDVVLSQVRVYFADGAGGYASPLIRVVSQAPQAVVVGDLTGDGALDVVVALGDPEASKGAEIAVLPGTGDRLLDPTLTYPVGLGVVALDLADVDGNGSLDVIAGNAVRAGISLLRNVGGGALGAEIILTNTTPTLGVPFVEVVAGDYNDDGAVDIAMNLYSDSAVQVAFGDGDGAFPDAPTFPVGLSPTALASADFDNDGVSDIATVCQGPNHIAVLTSLGDGLFAPAKTYPIAATPQRLAAGDINDDGRADIAVTSGSPGRLSVVAGVATGGFAPAYETLAGSLPFSVFIRDADGDALNDLVFLDLAFDRVDVLQRVCACVPDVTASGAVDETDLAVVLASWGSDNTDFNFDGVTDTFDLAVLLAAWGACP